MQDTSGEPARLQDRPAVGRTITLLLDPTRTRVAVGPALAALCGALASNGWQWQAERLLKLLLVLFLVEGLWSTWRALLVDIDWPTLARTHPPPTRGTMPDLPYLTPWSPLGKIVSGWSRLHRWARESLPHLQGSALMTLPFLPVLTLALSALLGRPWLNLSLLALALSSLEWFSTRRQPWQPSLQAIVQIVSSWMAGHLVFAPLSNFSLTLACAYALSYQGGLYLNDSRCTVEQQPWALSLLFGGQIFAAGALAWREHTIAAMLLGLLLVPQLLLRWQLDTARPRTGYLSHAAPFIGAAMVIAAWAI